MGRSPLFTIIDYHWFYVGLSRVRRGEDTRIIINKGVDSESILDINEKSLKVD